MSSQPSESMGFTFVKRRKQALNFAKKCRRLKSQIAFGKDKCIDGVTADQGSCGKIY